MSKIGIDFSVRKSAGGAYQYCLTFLDILSKKNSSDEFIIFNSSSDLPFHKYNENFQIVNLLENGTDQQILFNLFKECGYRILLFLRLTLLIDLLFKFFYRKQLMAIRKSAVELMLFPSGSKYAPYVTIPYLTTIYDLEHRKNSHFPELSKNGRWLSREHYFKGLCRTASKILVDSEVGKEDVVNFYGINPNKVAVLPYLPPNYLDDNISIEESKKVISGLNIPERFLFYPAQFWPHKNHINIVKAVALLREQGLIINVVFSGTKKKEWSEFDRVWNFVKSKGLENQVLYFGYVENNVMSALYRLAVAMIMPTYLGPTNIPVLEAWKMRCPVLYSDIRGCREQLGDAGLLIKPGDYEDVAKNIKVIWNDNGLREDLVTKGTKRLMLWGYSDFTTKLQNIISELINTL